MPQFPPALLGSIKRVPMRLRIVYGVAISVFVVLVIGGSYVLNKTSGNVSLYSRALEPQELKEVETRLAEDDVPYEVVADDVMVSAAKKGPELLKLLTEGVPHKPVTTSADALKEMNAMTPTLALEEGRVAGREGEITENLRGIPGVIDASVLIAPAQTGTFVDEPSHDATAAVRLTLARDATLPPESIGGLQSYIAGAVPGLSPQNVTITDQTGSNLATAASRPVDSDRALENKLNATLETIFGAHLAFATVDVEMQNSSSTSHEVKHVALQDKPIATDADREHYTSKNKSYDKVHENSDRGSDTIETNTQTAAGSIRRKAVAVFVSDRIVPRPSIAELTATIGAVAGIDLARGDTIKVETIPMPGAAGVTLPAPVPNAKASAVPEAMLATFAGVPWPILLLLLLTVGAVSYLGWTFGGTERKELAVLATTRLAADEFEPVRLHASLRDEPAHTAAAILATYPTPTATAVLELYAPDDRREIIKRLTKERSPVVRDVSVQAGRG